MDATLLMAMAASDGNLKRAVACYGSRTLTFAAYVPRDPGVGGFKRWEIHPLWMDFWSSVFFRGDVAGVVLNVYVPPGLGDCTKGLLTRTCPLGAYADRWILLSGHFDDPISSTCRASYTGADQPPSAPEAIAICRENFVLSLVQPLAARPGSTANPS